MLLLELTLTDVYQAFLQECIKNMPALFVVIMAIVAAIGALIVSKLHKLANRVEETNAIAKENGAKYDRAIDKANSNIGNTLPDVPERGES